MTDAPAPTPDPRRDAGDTSAKLIAAGLHLFGQRGFAGTSTRALADEAGVNVAAIGYHFGGKAGLRKACAEHLAERISAVFDAAASTPLPRTADAAAAEIERILRDFSALLLTTSGARDFVPFLLRELSDSGETADLIFEQVFLPRHARLCALWSVATGRPAEAVDVRLSVFASIGQVLYFRIAQRFVERRMGWDEIGPREATRIADTVTENLRLVLEGQSP